MKRGEEYWMDVLKAGAASRTHSNEIELCRGQLLQLANMWIGDTPGVHSYVWLYQHGHEKLRDQILWAKLTQGGYCS